MLPGGGAEDGKNLEAELARELREELAATAEIHSLLLILDHCGDCQYIYLARARSWSARPADRSGPEFTDPARGEYHLQFTPLTAGPWKRSASNQTSSPSFLLTHLRAGTDLFALPDLRASQPGRT